jgi:hypothetical protein
VPDLQYQIVVGTMHASKRNILAMNLTVTTKPAEPLKHYATEPKTPLMAVKTREVAKWKTN